MKNKFESLKKQIRYNIIYSLIFGKKKLTMKYFKKAQGYEYDFNNPVTFSEKINTRKLDNNKLFSICADKIKVREYVKEKIGEKYLIPLYFTCKKLDDKHYNEMPKSCILKTAGGSGTIKVIYDKDKENKEDIIKLMKDYQKVKFHYIWGEMFYKKIKNDILCEKLLLDKNGKIPTDIKVHCFKNGGGGGNTKFIIQLDFDRFTKHTRNFYDEKFNLIDLTIKGLKRNNEKIEKPKNLKEILQVSKKLSEDFDYVRVDLYSIEDKIYFGELTFTHSAGFNVFVPSKYDKLWGEYWKS